MQTIIERFLEKHSNLAKYQVFLFRTLPDGNKYVKEEFGISISHSVESLCEVDDKDLYHISINHPFVFDNRIVPKEFEKIKVRSIIVGDLPVEFDVDENDNYIPIEVYYAPEKYIRFVERCFDEIRRELGNPKLTKEELLDALAFEGDFSLHVQNMEELRIERIVGKQ